MSVYAAPPRPPQLSPPRSSYFSPPTVVTDTSPGKHNSFSLPLRKPLPPVPDFGGHHHDPHQILSSSPPASWGSSKPSSSSPPPITKHLPPNVRPATRSFSSFTPRMNRSSTSLLTAVRTPPVLAAVLAHLEWVDTFSLLASCKALRDLFRDQDSRDVVFARYLQGYKRALGERDLANYHEIPVSIHDLDLLLISQRVPLHRYPVHALRTLTSILPSLDDDAMSEKLIALSQAYSRVVLLLQSVAHSSNNPLSMELEEVKPRRRFTLVPNMRELTFPAPLAYSELASSSPASPMESFVNTRPGRTQRTLETGRQSSKNTTRLSIPGGYPGPTLTTKNSRSMMSTSDDTLRKGRRLSFFGKSTSGLPPPPPQEPQTLKQYHKSWRRTLKAPKEPSIDELGFMTDFERPTRRFASANNSSDSSISELGVVNDTSSSSSSASLSPHDFALATSRLRAPVLRVFVPCTKLEDGDINVELCERQLEDAGVWQHLSVGDLVCNLGYVPSAGDDSSSETDHAYGPSFTLPGLRSRSPRVHARRHSSGLSSTASAPERKWLIFTGDRLIPYTPPDDIPVHNPLSLPTPFYYAHIMSESACPVFYISQLPVCDDVPQLRLTATTTRLPSPHSPNGRALVKKYVWIARVVRLQGGEEDAAFGGGWFGEWVLEYEGTKEGKRTLLHALAGRNLGVRCWELVREKSGGGTLWLRLLPL
ncbi:hypothetical protein D9619_004414 [Psilocybe cf. subviscida]|uniref:F-box domain-containing protein n=1 Tax=Psilocybe cf. subviscida TaxID=2480587 RepID=A0A8H5BQK1_9AGAR|nr:hypothetical protein D9619_004414 [Psilocybe cf. subviscida]